MYSGDVVESVKSPGDPLLVCHHRDRYASLVEAGDSLGGPFDKLYAFYSSDKPVVDNNCAVAVEKDSRSRISTRRIKRRVSEIGIGRFHLIPLTCSAGPKLETIVLSNCM